jgi:glycerate 2-kinase
MRVLIAPDKFKGSLSAAEAAQAIAVGWGRTRPQDQLTLLPTSDGGDGFGVLLGQHLHAESREVDTVDAAHRKIRAAWWWHAGTRTAIVESARIIGLALLPPRQFHPFQLDTAGLGMALREVFQAEPSRCLVGIGGSATNDGGFGMAKALGGQFRDQANQEIPIWTGLAALQSIHLDALSRPNLCLEVAVDVQNPLLGPLGCTRVYGPQKGLRPEDFSAAESCLGQLAAVCSRLTGRDDANEPGAGAAGGLGFGLRTFLNAQLRPGFAMFAELTRLEEVLARSDLVLTGEGAIDASSLMGKGVGELMRRSCARGIPCLGLCGIIQDYDLVRAHFSQLHCLTPELTTPALAMAEPAQWLARAAERAARAV